MWGSSQISRNPDPEFQRVKDRITRASDAVLRQTVSSLTSTPAHVLHVSN